MQEQLEKLQATLKELESNEQASKTKLKELEEEKQQLSEESKKKGEQIESMR